MRRILLSVATAFLLSACGGNPFTTDTDTTGTDTGGTDTGGTDTTVSGTIGPNGEFIPDIPTEISSDLQSITYDPVNQTLIVTGISLDEGFVPATYTRNPGLDRRGYEAYTFQDDPLDRHVTAFVKEIDGTRAAIVVTGGQFGHYFGGGTYSRDGAFDPPSGGVNGGLVSYAGNYVGLLNIAGDGGDLIDVDAGTPPELIPDQAAEVTGSIFINADFADNVVNGTVFDRSVVDNPGLIPVDQELLLSPTDITRNGSFTGDISGGGTGTYGGIFGGTDASAVAGSLFASGHIGADSEEFGLFVLSQCGTPNDDPICSQVNP
jgi:hypothetical protein